MAAILRSTLSLQIEGLSSLVGDVSNLNITRVISCGKAIAWKNDFEKLMASDECAWIPADGNANVAGRDIGGMVYVGKPPKDVRGKDIKSKALIDPTLPVAGTTDPVNAIDEGIKAGYSEMDPKSRATYLDWLAAGRCDQKLNNNLVLLYIYGLERRYFVDDSSNEEKRAIMDEVIRLGEIYNADKWLQNCLYRFLHNAKIAIGQIDSIEPLLSDPDWYHSRSRYRGMSLSRSIPMPLSIPLGVKLHRREGIPADLALGWLICAEHFYELPVKLWRCFDEFRALYKIIFDEVYPEGLDVSRPPKNLKITYTSLSDEFDLAVEFRDGRRMIADITGKTWDLQYIRKIVDYVYGELEGFIRFLGRNPDGHGSVEAQEHLPEELRELFPCKQMEDLERSAAKSAADGNLVQMDSLLGILEGALPRTSGIRQMVVAADALEKLGYALAPDPRYEFKHPGKKEPVVIFKIEKPDEMSERYHGFYNFRCATMKLALGSFVVHSDECSVEARRRVLEETIEKASEGLDECETRRLQYNLKRFLAVPPSMPFLRRNLKDFPRSEFPALRAAIVAAAIAGGNVQSGQVAAIENLYGAIGLDSSLAYSDLHARGSEESLRLPEDLRKLGGGDAIQSSVENAGTALDFSRVASIRSDTDRVSSKLGEIFEAEDPSSGQRNSGRAGPQGLEGKLAALIAELIQRGRWTEEEFGRLCEQCSLPAAGVMEAVNEWAFDVFGAALLDESDGYEISPQVADGARKMFEEARSETVEENES